MDNFQFMLAVGDTKVTEGRRLVASTLDVCGVGFVPATGSLTQQLNDSTDSRSAWSSWCRGWTFVNEAASECPPRGLQATTLAAFVPTSDGCPP